MAKPFAGLFDGFVALLVEIAQVLINDDSFAFLLIF